MSAVFSTVFCDYILIISWVTFVYCNFFVMAADRLLIICLYYSGDMHHSLSFNSEDNVHISRLSPISKNKKLHKNVQA